MRRRLVLRWQCLQAHDVISKVLPDRNFGEQRTVDERDPLAALVGIATRELPRRPRSHPGSRHRLGLGSAADSPAAQLGADEGLDKASRGEHLTVVGRGVESDDRGVGVDVRHAVHELSRVLGGCRRGGAKVRSTWSFGGIEADQRRHRLTGLDALALLLGVGRRASKGTRGETERVRDFEGALCVDAEQLTDGRGEGDGRVGRVGRSRVDGVRLARVLDDLHEGLLQ